MALTIHPNDSKELAFPRMLGRKPSKAKKVSVPESFIQDAAEAYLTNLGLTYLHIPAYLLNAAFSSRSGVSGGVLWAMREASSQVRGFPDLCIFHPNGKDYLAVELKTEIGKLTDAQEKWKKALNVYVVRSVAEFKELVQKWLEETT